MSLVDFCCIGSMVLVAPHLPRRTALILSYSLNALAAITIVVNLSRAIG